MVLSNTDIKEYLADGRIKIVPFEEGMVYPASCAFTLGSKLLKPHRIELVDFRNKIIPEYEEIDMTNAGYVLQPGEFLLGQTAQKISLCDEVVMIVEGRSTLARAGIEVTQTSTFIEPDHIDSIITLEIKNNSNSGFLLHPGMKFCKGIFLKLNQKADLHNSKTGYKTQDEVSKPNLNTW